MKIVNSEVEQDEYFLEIQIIGALIIKSLSHGSSQTYTLGHFSN